MASHQQGHAAKAILYAFVANLGIALAKTWAAIFTSSGSMMAEAIHSYADTGNQVLLYLGLRQSVRPPDAEHPLGYGKLSYFWAFIVAILLFSMGGLFSIYEGFHKLHAAEPLTKPWVGLVVLAFSIVLELFSLLGCLREIKLLRRDRALREWLKNTRNAELVVVLGEDIAALLGLVLAFVFLGLTTVTGNVVYDAMGSICIGVVLIVVSIFVALRIRSLLVGRSAEPALQQVIDEIIASQDGIEKVFNTITMQFGPKVMLAAKLKLSAGMSIETAIEQINELERRIKERAPEVGWCFMEPDLSD